MGRARACVRRRGGHGELRRVCGAQARVQGASPDAGANGHVQLQVCQVDSPRWFPCRAPAMLPCRAPAHPSSRGPSHPRLSRLTLAAVSCCFEALVCVACKQVTRGGTHACMDAAMPGPRLAWRLGASSGCFPSSFSVTMRATRKRRLKQQRKHEAAGCNVLLHLAAARVAPLSCTAPAAARAGNVGHGARESWLQAPRLACLVL